MRQQLCLSVVGIMLAFASPVAAQLTDAAATSKAEAILKSLQGDKAADVVKEFDARMAQAISEAQLQAVWQSMVGKFGAVKSIDERRVGLLKGMQSVELMLTFDSEKVVQRVVFTSDGQVAGLAFQPANMALLPAAK
jgi:Tfp pilus assembly protein FimT